MTFNKGTPTLSPILSIHPSLSSLGDDQGLFTLGERRGDPSRDRSTIRAPTVRFKSPRNRHAAHARNLTLS